MCSKAKQYSKVMRRIDDFFGRADQNDSSGGKRDQSKKTSGKAAPVSSQPRSKPRSHGPDSAKKRGGNFSRVS